MVAASAVEEAAAVVGEGALCGEQEAGEERKSKEVEKPSGLRQGVTP